MSHFYKPSQSISLAEALYKTKSPKAEAILTRNNTLFLITSSVWLNRAMHWCRDKLHCQMTTLPCVEQHTHTYIQAVHKTYRDLPPLLHVHKQYKMARAVYRHNSPSIPAIRATNYQLIGLEGKPYLSVYC